MRPIPALKAARLAAIAEEFGVRVHSDSVEWTLAPPKALHKSLTCLPTDTNGRRPVPAPAYLTWPRGCRTGLPPRLPAWTVPLATGWTPATSNALCRPTQPTALPLGLGVLTRKDVTAWRRPLAHLISNPSRTHRRHMCRCPRRAGALAGVSCHRARPRP